MPMGQDQRIRLRDIASIAMVKHENIAWNSEELTATNNQNSVSSSEFHSWRDVSSCFNRSQYNDILAMLDPRLQSDQVHI